MHSLRTPARLAGTALASLALATALTACGSDSDSKSGDSNDAAAKVDVLSEPDATSALLVEANLGGKLKQSTDSADDDEAPGCMKGVTEILGDNDTAENTAERDFESDTLFASNKVLSYTSVAAAKKAIEDVRKALQDCPAVKETDSDGFSYDLTVTTDDDKASDDADDEVNALASGKVTAADASGESQVGLHLALVRIENNITAVTASTFDSELPGPVSDVVEVVVDRLLAVMDGKQPDDTVVAGG